MQRTGTWMSFEYLVLNLAHSGMPSIKSYRLRAEIVRDSIACCICLL